MRRSNRRPIRAAAGGAALGVVLATAVSLMQSPAFAAGPNVVVTAADSGSGSLRDAITYANAHPGTTIAFQIPAGFAVAGIFTIKPGSPLPQITAAGTIIDGTTQTGYTGNTNPLGPEIELGGGNAGAANGLTLAAANVTVKGLTINSFGQAGIRIAGANATGDKVQGCYLGVTSTGTSPSPNAGAGVEIVSPAAAATIGGAAGAARNVISGNKGSGVWIAGGVATGHLVQGNYIGTDASGAAALPNGVNGVLISGAAHGNSVGGTAAGTGNVISGNTADGVLVTDAGSNANVIAGNLVGLNKDGTAALGNGAEGVALIGSIDGSTIGGTSALAARNVISGNSGVGVTLYGASNTLVQGNYVGVGIGGEASIPNLKSGVFLANGAHDNTVGGTTAAARNVIGGNLGNGVLVTQAGKKNLVQGNYIGLTASGARRGNEGNGVLVSDGTEETTIGGTAAGARNVISGNLLDGIRFSVAGPNNVVQGNHVGTKPDGSAAIGNLHAGVNIGNTNGTLIGGDSAAARNVISGNEDSGVFITPGASNTTISANRIGTNAAGTAAVPNLHYGIALIAGAGPTVIGGLPAAGNLVSGNKLSGISLKAPGCVVDGNLVGVNAAGTAALTNGGSGISVSTGPQTIGEPGAGNVFSGNAQWGVDLFGSGCTGILLRSNLIGLNIVGSAPVANGADGVRLQYAHGCHVGGTLSAYRNVISGNAGNGVAVSGEFNTTGNLIEGNYIGTNAAGTAAVPNGANGVLFDDHAQGEKPGGPGPFANAVGGFAGARNVISGNALDGVQLKSGMVNNIIQGNYVGLNAAGTAGIPNGQCGIACRGSFAAIQGTFITNNVVSANKQGGVYVHGPASWHTIQGNTIGADASGSTILANQGPGIRLISEVTNCKIGGMLETERNVVSGNTQEGIRVESACDFVQVLGNFVGTDATGLAKLKNGSHGVLIGDGVTNCAIGGTVAGSANVISGNAGCGVLFFGPTDSANRVQGCFVGTDRNGAAAIPNALDGVRVTAAAHHILVGGDTAAARNIISGNTGAGVRLQDNLTAENWVRGNYIGTDAGGASGIPNAKSGVEVAQGASKNWVGGPGVAYANRIAYNTGDGVLVAGATTKGTSIRFNLIYANGGIGINLESSGAVGMVTPNDDGDMDGGPNSLQNFPVVTSAVVGAGTSIKVRAYGTPGSVVIVDLFYGKSGEADPSGYGQGPKYYGSKTAAISAAGFADLNWFDILPYANAFFSGTSTDLATGETSEFGPWKKTQPARTP